MARVVLLSLIFAPDHVSTAQLLGELAVDIRDLGHDLTVVTTKPHYQTDPGQLLRQPMQSVWGGLFYRSAFLGIPVIHTWMPRKGRAILDRITGWLAFQVLALVALIGIVRRADVVIVQSPLLSLAVVAWLFGVFKGSRYIYNVWELYPDLAIHAGVVRNRALIAALRRLERFVYARSAAITAASRGIQCRILATGVPPSKVHYSPNFVDLADLSPGPKDNRFARENGLVDKFVVSYAGNMGPMQDLEFLLDAAACSLGDVGILFLFVGSGARAETLRADAAARELTNVRFLGQLPYERVPEIYAASDVSVVPLRASIGQDALPSKVLRIMACGRPVLAFTGENSDLANVVAESGAGVIVPAASGEELARSVRALRSDPQRCEAMGKAGRDYVARFYSRASVSSAYSRLVTAVSRGGESAVSVTIGTDDATAAAQMLSADPKAR